MAWMLSQHFQKIPTMPPSWFFTSVLQNCERINFCCLKIFSFISHSTCSLEAEGLNNYLSFSLKLEWEYMPYVSKVTNIFLNINACELWHYVTTGCLWDITRIDWTMEWKSCLKAEVELEQQASKVHISDPPTLLWKTLTSSRWYSLILNSVCFQ